MELRKLCLRPNAAEKAWMADRYFCSLPIGHDEPCIAYVEHDKTKGVLWNGAFQ